MNRQIKFRGKNKTGEWVYGNLVQHPTGTAFIVRYATSGAPEWHEVDRDSVGEWTGLRDRNDKPIFEGDILRIVSRGTEPYPDWAKEVVPNPPAWIAGGEEIARVSFFDAAFQLCYVSTFLPGEECINRQEPLLTMLFAERHPDVYMHFETYVELIGNATDNPDLMRDTTKMVMKGGEK